MKASSHKTFGVILVVGALLTAALIQTFGPGLVVIDQVSMTPLGPGPGGVPVERTSWYLLRILPLTAAALAGIVCLSLPKRVNPD